MVLVRIRNGLGNQMYCYAIYEYFKSIGVNVKMDISSFSNPDEADYNYRKYELDNAFGIKADTMNFLEHAAYVVMRKLGIFKEIKDSSGYNKELLNKHNNAIYNGAWETFNYSSGIEDRLRRAFVFRNVQNNEFNKVLKGIIESNSVSVSIRRGDFLQYGMNMADSYYSNAFKYMNERLVNPKYFVFSDDVAWCKENIKADNIVYVERFPDGEDWWDLKLLSSCKHNIVCMSTFSIWGAWLNSNKDKIVLRPDITNVRDKMKKYLEWKFPKEWIPISEE